MLLPPNAHQETSNSFWPRFHIVVLYCANVTLLLMVIALSVSVRKVEARDPSLAVYCQSYLIQVAMFQTLTLRVQNSAC